MDKSRVQLKGTIEIYRDNMLVHTYKNLVVSAGLSYLRNLLIGDASLETFAYLALGTGTGSSTSDMTTLQTEGFRVAHSDLAIESDEIKLKTLLETGDANGTWTEAGLFLSDGSLTTDSGTMFSRAKLSPSFVKDSTTAVVVVWRVQFASA